MSKQRDANRNARVQAAVAELETLIRRRYPEATFAVSPSVDDPDAINLYATVDANDQDDVLELVLPRLFELQDAGLPLHVIPLRTPEREEQVAAQLAKERKHFSL